MRKVLLGGFTVIAIASLAATVGARPVSAAPIPISSCNTTITTSGNYLVTGDLTTSGTSCITVAASNVIIDVGGHTLTGDYPSVNHDGITDGGTPRSGIIVRNGEITNFQRGINLLASTSSQVRNVKAIGNAESGIELGAHSIVTGCTASSTQFGVGISIGEFGQVANCIVSDNESFGIVGVAHSQITGNHSNGNQVGIFMFGGFNLVTNNICNENDASGIVSHAQSQISGNTA